VVRAAGANVCNYTHVAEEAIIYWLLITEEEGWFSAFETKYLLLGGIDMGDGDDDTGPTKRKKCGTH
jgi:hypothetical protein